MSIDDNTKYSLTGEQVKDIASQVKKRAASVNNDGASHVEFANQIHTDTLQVEEGDFVFRTTAGTLSIETGPAVLMSIKGKTTSTTEQEVTTLHTATPTSFVATGYNQYNSSTRIAHVVGGQEYRVVADRAYSFEFSVTGESSWTTITLDNGRYTPPTDGYFKVTTSYPDEVLVALVWSGIRDDDPLEPYEESVILIPTTDKDGTELPTASYGMPSVGDVADELNLQEKTYVQRIGHYPYTAENLVAVQALGVEYIYDATDIFYVLADPIIYHLDDSVSANYIANDFGTEEFLGTAVPLGVEISYGNNLVDKLRNLLDVQGIGPSLRLENSILDFNPIALTTEHYNWNTTTNDQTEPYNAVALWLLPSGIYMKDNYSVEVRMNKYQRYSSPASYVVFNPAPDSSSIDVAIMFMPIDPNSMYGITYLITKKSGEGVSGWNSLQGKGFINGDLRTEDYDLTYQQSDGYKVLNQRGASSLYRTLNDRIGASRTSIGPNNVGEVGQLRYVTNSTALNKVGIYVCTAKTPQGTTPETYKYTWELVHEAGGGNYVTFYIDGLLQSPFTDSQSTFAMYKDERMSVKATGKDFTSALRNRNVKIRFKKLSDSATSEEILFSPSYCNIPVEDTIEGFDACPPSATFVVTERDRCEIQFTDGDPDATDAFMISTMSQQ